VPELKTPVRPGRRPAPPLKSPASRFQTPGRRLLADRAASWLVALGGVGIISAIFGILIFIVLEFLPVFGGAAVTPARRGSLAGQDIGALIGDEYRTHVVALCRDGKLRVVRLEDHEVIEERPFLPPPGAGGPEGPVTAQDLLELKGFGTSQLLSASTRAGRVLVAPVVWSVTFDAEAKRVVVPLVQATLDLEVDPAHRPLGTYTVAKAQVSDRTVVAAQLADGVLALLRHTTEENPFTGEKSLKLEREELGACPALSTLVLDQEQRNLYGGTAAGELLWWRLGKGKPGEPQVVRAGGSEVTSLSLLVGDRSLVVGQADGSLSVWFPVRREDETFILTRTRDFPPHSAPIRHVEPSLRNRTFLALDGEDAMGLYFSTSNRVLWTGRSPLARTRAVFLHPRADGATLAAGGALAELEIDNPHPELGWQSLFERTFYEGYPEPDHVWQSSSGTDDFEPKLGLTPLLIGTLKGTIYALLLAVPLAVLGAMYASQFMSPRLQGYVKPAVEIMAALPSVILGFLAGLWLAPMLDQYFCALLLALVVCPPVILLAGRLWSLLPLGARNRLPLGSEVALFMVVLAMSIWLCVKLSQPTEDLLFAGNFQEWLYETTGLHYDQRNAVVIGIAMGFAVIPIIFTIAEEAFSSVPRNLVAGSLALGATRWQTVSRVVLPTASPGVFSAVMVGFGRAVGETMIVVMATGNTPIMDWNPFNGFRTLSANIAVEIPEAPHGGTLYRTLFMAAFLLFVVTFAVNTVADLVRQRLRRRYAQL
jgi:phosphate transport system permease protein